MKEAVEKSWILRSNDAQPTTEKLAEAAATEKRPRNCRIQSLTALSRFGEGLIVRRQVCWRDHCLGERCSTLKLGLR